MRMPVDELSHVKADVDYSQIPPIQQKRIIAFVNHFVTNTVSYLNNFCQSCESRFMEFEYKMQKIEASLLILEAQLSSLPGFDKQETQIENGTKSSGPNTSVNHTSPLPKVPHPVEAVPVSLANGTSQHEAEVDNTAPSGVKASEDPRFAKFFKLFRVGVREQDVKQKMQTEGIDPTILDNPDAIIPDSEENN